jgi:hypothetical protein
MLSIVFVIRHVVLLTVMEHAIKKMHTYIHTYVHTYIQHTHTHTHTHVHTYIHTHTCTYIHTYTHMYVHTYTHTHTYILQELYKLAFCVLFRRYCCSYWFWTIWRAQNKC